MVDEFILVALHDQPGAGGEARGRKIPAAHRWRHRHQQSRGETGQRPQRHIGTEGEAGKPECTLRPARPTPVHHREQVVRLAPALVVGPGRCPDTAEIEAQGGNPPFAERARHGMHDLVRERPAELRMRMADDAEGRRRPARHPGCRPLEERIDRARGARNRQRLRGDDGRHRPSSRSGHGASPKCRPADPRVPPRDRRACPPARCPVDRRSRGI